MFWPLILPFQITCGVLLVGVALLTMFASPKSGNHFKSLCFYSLIGLVAFIPSCTGIMMAIDAVRFGDFKYASFHDIPDFRSQRYLPEAATEIQMRKHANGYFARYKLSSDEFISFLDELWQKYGEFSAADRGEHHKEGRSFKSVDPESFDRTFADLGWVRPTDAIVYYSPSEADGGGATYYVDADSGLVFQRTEFW